MIHPADFLERYREAILARWIEALREERPAYAKLTQQQILDSVGLFVAEIIVNLRAGRGPLLDDDDSSLAQEHGAHRHLVGCAAIEDVVCEEGLFFDVVLAVAMETHADLALADIAALQRCLNTGAAHSAKRFAREQTDARRRQDYEHFAFLAHELRNPLASARYAWEHLRMSLRDLPERSSAVLTKNLDVIAALVDHALLDVRLRSLGSGVELKTDVLSLAPLFDDVEFECTADADAKQIRLLSDDAGARVVGDSRLLRSAVTNLVRNAVKFSRPGGHVVLQARENGPRTLIEVRDECGGIPPEKIEKVFEAFNQVGRDRSGFGLGLAIAKQAVEAQGGAISVENAPPNGCVFVIDMPAAAGSTPAAG